MLLIFSVPRVEAAAEVVVVSACLRFVPDLVDVEATGISSVVCTTSSRINGEGELGSRVGDTVFLALPRRVVVVVVEVDRRVGSNFVAVDAREGPVAGQ